MKARFYQNKFISFIFSLFVFFVFNAFISVSNAQTRCEDTALWEAFGCSSIISNSENINIWSFVQVFFSILLSIAFLVTTFYIVMTGIKIAQAKEDTEKRKKSLQSIISALIGLIIALLASGITGLAASLVGVRVYEVKLPCIAKDEKTWATFSGFVYENDPNSCVLLDAEGNKVFRGLRN